MHELKEKNVLVTGGAGFIGSELTRQLIAEGARVTVVDNFINGKAENLSGVIHFIKLEKVDIRNQEAMQRILQNCDLVFHLACLGVRHSIHSPFENHEVNATATLHLLECAKKSKVKKFVYVSSSEIYGTAITVPMTEEHPVLPHTVYGASKLAGESYARAFFKTYHYPTVIVRPFNAFGPRSHHEGDSGEVIPKFMLRALTGKPMIIFGDGMQTRDFTFVSDIARGILLAGMIEDAVGQTINLGSANEISINALAKEIAFIAGLSETKMEYHQSRSGDVLRLCADTTKAKKILGFETKISLQEGLEKLCEWYHSQKDTLESLLNNEVIYNWKKEYV